MFPLWEKSEGKYTLNYKNADPIPVADFVKGIGKFKKLSAEQLPPYSAPQMSVTPPSAPSLVC